MGISSEPNHAQILQNHQIHQFYHKLQIHQFLSFHIVVSVSVSASVIIFAIITHLRKLCAKVKCRKLLKTRFCPTCDSFIISAAPQQRGCGGVHKFSTLTKDFVKNRHLQQLLIDSIDFPLSSSSGRVSCH